MSLSKNIDKFFPRKEQRETIDFIDNVYKSDKNIKFFLLNLPTGVGKSYLSLLISDWYLRNVDRNAKIDIITNSKILQDQYTQTFDCINDLKGKDNYECVKYSCSCQNGAEFNRLNKTKCDWCPYNDARDSFINGKISLTNFYLYILYALYIEKAFEARGAKVLIVDECHNFDDIMSDFISIKITEGVIKKYKFANSKEILKKLKLVKSIQDYVDFLTYMTGEVKQTIDEMEKSMGSQKRSPKLDKRTNKISAILGTQTDDVKHMQLITDLVQFGSKIEIFLKEYALNPDNWVLEKTFNEKTKDVDLSLEPIWAYDYLDKYVFSKYDMVFLMSGTILDKQLFCQLNGLDVSKTVYYSIESPFPADNRKVYYMPLGKMSYAKKEETFKNYIPYLKKILSKYSGKKGIIHTNSFELASWINKGVQDKRLVYHDSSNKDEVLEKHYQTDEPTVIVSPSLSVGVSFDEDKARFQVIAKIPYPSLASQKNKLRQKINPEWYSWSTCASLIQSCGRIIRSEEDWGDTLILDGSFSDLLRYSSKYLPNWFQESIRKVNVKV